MAIKRAIKTKAKALTVADIKAACLEALGEYFYAGELIKTEAVGEPVGEMTAPPPESKLGYLANMMRAR